MCKCVGYYCHLSNCTLNNNRGRVDTKWIPAEGNQFVKDEDISDVEGDFNCTSVIMMMLHI